MAITKKIKEMSDAELLAEYNELCHEVYMLLVFVKSGVAKDKEYSRLDDRRCALYLEAFNRKNKGCDNAQAHQTHL